MNKKIIFVTGTRADWGKLKSLILEIKDHSFEVFIFITGMHNDSKYGNTYLDVQRVRGVNFHRFDNKTDESSMDLTVSKTIEGFSNWLIHELKSSRAVAFYLPCWWSQLAPIPDWQTPD